jgi:hypothetical protein
MGKFIRENLPSPIAYYEAEGLPLEGTGIWRTAPCHFHGGSRMRVNTLTGGFVCMAACGARGGNVLDYHRAAHGMGFVEAVKALGAWVEDGTPYTGSTRPTQIPARDLLRLVAHELVVAELVMSDCLRGQLVDADFDRFAVAAGRVLFVAEVANGFR